MRNCEDEAQRGAKRLARRQIYATRRFAPRGLRRFRRLSFLTRRFAHRRFDDDDDFKVRAREGVVRLQSGDEESLAAWRCLCATSRKEYAKIYDLLSIENLEERGESFYNDMLKGVVEDLEEQVRCSEERSDELATRQFRSLFGCASSSSLDIHNTITTA